MLNIQENINLSKYSTFRVGGEARYFIKVSTQEELEEALNFSKEKKVESFILGGGSNVIFSDKGFGGIVIKLSGKQIEAKDKKILCWAGTNLWDLVNFSKENSLTGLEGLSGVPGTVGGAIFGNAGAFGSEVSDFIESVLVFDQENQKLVNFSKKECVFKYRESIFKKNRNLIIVSAFFDLKRGDEKEIKSRIEEVNDSRGNKQPKDWLGSTGSFFKNPRVENEKIINQFEKLTGEKVIDKKIPAGWLIEKAGLLGKQIGKIKVSEKHGNFILNTGEGTAEEVIMLVSLIKQKVRETFEIEIKEEVQLIGFNN